MTKKLFTLVVALVMIATMATGAMAESALEPATFSIWTWLGTAEGWGAQSLSEVQCFQVADETTNTTIEWSIQDENNSFDLMMSSGDTTDGIYYAWNPVRTAQYSAAGLIQDISAYIPEFMPNLNALIESDPMVKKQLVSADGGIYFVPWITSEKTLVFGEGFGIRQDWLDKYDLAVPTTPDELYTALKTFRDEDANENGQNDEIITGYGAQLYRAAYAFATADDFHYEADGSTVVFGPATDNYREFLTFMNKLYAEGILDPDYFSNDSDLYMKKCQENRVGAYVDNPGVFATIMKDGAANGVEMNYVPMEYMLYEGQSLNLSSAARRYVQPYGVAISTSCEDVGRFLQYFDFFFTEEGNDLLNWGVEGVSYTVENGEKQFTEAVLEDPNYEPVTALSQFASPTFVGIQSAEAQLSLYTEAQAAFNVAWAKSDASLAIEPFLAFTAEESEVNTTKLTDLNTIKNAWRDQFITGDKNLETDWEAYLAELTAYGMEDLVAIRQASTDRYQAK